VINETMRREIVAQPDEVARAIPLLRDQVQRLGLAAAGPVVAGGCGDSFFASQVGAGFFAGLPIPYAAATALEICHWPAVGPGDLCILISISGGTRRTVEAAAAARQAGARTLAVTCRADSALALSCDASLLLPFTPLSRKTPHTLDYTMTVLALAVIAERLGGRPFEWIDRLPGLIRQAIDHAGPDCPAVVSDATAGTRWFFLGAGPGVGLAAYGAAKLHEAGGLIAWGAELENFMHGMNFMLERDDRVCLIAHDPSALRYARRLRGSMAAVGARPWLVLPDGGISGDGQAASPGGPAALVTAAMPLQLVCLALAESLGLSLEAPRGGRADGPAHLEAQSRYLQG
jgi:fructoselysine-6-P-deglycase FrlB-like protein